MTDVLAAALLVLGSLFVFVSALGLVRMPDLYTRMHSAAKAGTLGTGLVLAAVALDAGDVRALVTLLFLLVTAPIAAHALGRAARRPPPPEAPP